MTPCSTLKSKSPQSSKPTRGFGPVFGSSRLAKDKIIGAEDLPRTNGNRSARNIFAAGGFMVIDVDVVAAGAPTPEPRMER